MVRNVNMKIFNELSDNNYIYTDMKTPIFTVKTKKYKNLSRELRKNGIIAEDCCSYLNLDSSFSRIRINKDYEKLIKVLKKILWSCIKIIRKRYRFF